MNETRSAALAAAIIIGVTGTVFYYLPAMMMGLSEFSPWLSYALAILVVAAFFGVFWLRGRFRNRGGDGSRSDRP